MWAVVPVKELDEAKRRLAGQLAPHQRRSLVEAMLEDVLDALQAVEELAGILVVTRDAIVERRARERGVDTVAEDERGLNAALAQAGELLEARGAQGMLIVPGDVPGVTPGEIRRVLARHGSAPRAVTLVADRQGNGTNCLVSTPPRLCDLRFGIDSFAAHRAAAAEVGVEATVVELPGLGLDLDVVEDLRRSLATGSGSHTLRLLESWPAVRAVEPVLEETA